MVGCSTPPVKKYHPIQEKSGHKLEFTFSKRAIDKINRKDEKKGPNNYGLAYMSCTNKTYYDKLPREYKKYLEKNNIYQATPNEVDIYYAFREDGKTKKDPEGSHTRIALSKKYFDMALMSNNVYEDPNHIYVLPDRNLLLGIRSDSGLDMHVYGDKDSIRDSSIIVFAFGGTDQLIDWKANLPIPGYLPLQYKQAIEQVDKILAENPTAQVFATGHSLGGGIAINLAYQNQRVQSVAFNPSPKAFVKRKYKKIEENKQPVVFLEKGEILTMLTFYIYTKPRLRNAWIANFNALDYVGVTQNAEEHNMYDLSRAVMHAALTNGDQRAKEYFTANISKESAASNGEGCSTYFKN